MGLPTVSSSLPYLPTIDQTAKDDANIDTSVNGKAVTFDGKNSPSSDGKGICNTASNIVGGIVDCKSSLNNPNQANQFTVDYSIIEIL